MCLGDDSYLATPDRVDQTTTFDNRFRADEDEIDFIHDISYGRIKNHSTRNAGCGENFIGLETILIYR